MSRWLDLPWDLRTQADVALGQAFRLECEQAGHQAIVATFQRKQPRQLPSRWTEVQHARALRPRADLIETADETPA